MPTPEPESRPVPLEPDPRLTKAGQRWGQGLASILPYLARSLESKPKAPLPAQPAEEKGTSRR